MKSNLTVQKILVVISPNLQNIYSQNYYSENIIEIIDKIHKKEIDPIQSEIITIVCTNAEPNSIEIAVENNIPVKTITESKLSGIFEELNPDLIAVIGSDEKFSSEIISKYEGKILKIQPSLDLNDQKSNNFQEIIDEGLKQYGATAHFVSKTQAVILQAKVPVFPNDTATELEMRILTQEKQIFPLAIQWFLTGRLSLESGKAILDGNILPSNGYAAD